MKKKKKWKIWKKIDIESDFQQYFTIIFQLIGNEKEVANKYKELIKDEDKTIPVSIYKVNKVYIIYNI